MFLQLQKILKDKIILKGGAATQFYIPITSQRTSVDIDMLCLASRNEVENAINQIESTLIGENDLFKFKIYEPKNPRVGLDELITYYQHVPSICSNKELFATRGRQDVKIEFLLTKNKYPINKIKSPELFAMETEEEFNILALENLFADKLTTLGPNTIGISEDRADEQFSFLLTRFSKLLPQMDRVLFSQKFNMYDFTVIFEYGKSTGTSGLIHRN